jgi:hypothetical protein
MAFLKKFRNIHHTRHIAQELKQSALRIFDKKTKKPKGVKPLKKIDFGKKY